MGRAWRGQAAAGDAPSQSAPSAVRNRRPDRGGVGASGPCAGPGAGNRLEARARHVVRFAAAMPGLDLEQPTDLRSGASRLDRGLGAEAGLAQHPRARCPRLDAARPGWAAEHGARVELVVLVNRVAPLISAPGGRETGADPRWPRWLAPGRPFRHLYGPFLRDGEATSEGRRGLSREPARAGPPRRLQATVIDTCATLVRGRPSPMSRTVAMPANNLLLVFERRAAT